MTTRTIGTILIILLSIISCQTKKGIDENKIDNADTVLTADKVFQTETADEVVQAETADSIKTEENFDISDCIRGQAKPILKRDKFPNSSFKINEDGLSGTETTDLKNGDKLIIINGGCEYYVLTFRFETSRFQGDTTDINFWASKIVDLMTEITDGIESPIDLKKGTATLGQYIKENKIGILEDITFEPGEIRTYLNIDRVQKIDSKKYGLEISYIVGPL